MALDNGDELVAVTGKESGKVAIVATSSLDDAVDLVDELDKGGKSITSWVEKLLSNRPELTGTVREKLLATVQDEGLAKIVSELYRHGATVGDGGTAAKLIQEFYEGTSQHLIKATERLKQLKKLLTSGNLGFNDLEVAEALIEDLEMAISLFN